MSEVARYDLLGRCDETDHFSAEGDGRIAVETSRVDDSKNSVYP